MVWVVDQFNPSGTGGSSYSGGQITNVWGNWFGGAFQSLSWDSTSDAGNNPGSGSMQIIANFAGTSNQFEVYNGFNGIVPTLNGLLYTNFECDVRFAPGSATVTNGGVAIFGHLQFGVATATDGQDYFGGVDVPASNTNWVHVSLPINAVADPNLQAINDVLIHMVRALLQSGLERAFHALGGQHRVCRAGSGHHELRRELDQCVSVHRRVWGVVGVEKHLEFEPGRTAVFHEQQHYLHR